MSGVGKVLLLVKADEWGARAEEIARRAFPSLCCERGNFGDPMPSSLARPDSDTVISFLSPWIVPAAVLARARLAINFHPGSCDYPGIGCYNFALYDGAVRYGAVCHYMAETVDTGTIIREDLFPVAADESVKSLRDRTLDVMLAMFDDIVGLLERGAALPSAPRGWTRRPFLRRELRDLGRITLDMSAEEIRRRVRAMHYPGMPGAEVEIAGVRFVAAPVTP